MSIVEKEKGKKYNTWDNLVQWFLVAGEYHFRDS